MFTKQELEIIIQLVSQYNDPTSEGKLIIGKLQAKIEAILAESQIQIRPDASAPDNS